MALRKPKDFLLSDLVPEVSLAQSIVEGESFSPGSDLSKLVKKFADIEYLPIPGKVDGVSYNLKCTKKPHILINDRENPPTRQKFTLAHEFGHVMIPWHIGTFCSHIDLNRSENDDYARLEAEANRFASELLIPTKWAKEILGDTHNRPDETLKLMVDTVGISYQAAVIKLMQCLPSGFVCLESYRDSFHEYSSPKTITSAPDPHDAKQVAFYDKIADKRFELNINKYQYKWWYFKNPELPKLKESAKSWRDSLNEVLQKVPSENRLKVQQSLNGIISVGYTAHQDIKGAYSHIISRVKGCDYAKWIINHPLMEEFVVLRLRELYRKK